MNTRRIPDTCSDIECFNENTLLIDLDALELEVLDQRLELALATLFGPADIGIESAGCVQNTCTGYIPPDV